MLKSVKMLRCRYEEYDEGKEEYYKEGMKGGVISPARVQMEIFKEESLEGGIIAIRRAM
jgi:hypothetical protein